MPYQVRTQRIMISLSLSSCILGKDSTGVSRCFFQCLDFTVFSSLRLIATHDQRSPFTRLFNPQLNRIHDFPKDINANNQCNSLAGNLNSACRYHLPCHDLLHHSHILRYNYHKKILDLQYTHNFLLALCKEVNSINQPLINKKSQCLKKIDKKTITKNKISNKSIL